jgi:hypothetical protein
MKKLGTLDLRHRTAWKHALARFDPANRSSRGQSHDHTMVSAMIPNSDVAFIDALRATGLSRASFVRDAVAVAVRAAKR